MNRMSGLQLNKLNSGLKIKIMTKATCCDVLEEAKPLEEIK